MMWCVCRGQLTQWDVFMHQMEPLASQMPWMLTEGVSHPPPYPACSPDLRGLHRLAYMLRTPTHRILHIGRHATESSRLVCQSCFKVLQLCSDISVRISILQPD